MIPSAISRARAPRSTAPSRRWSGLASHDKSRAGSDMSCFISRPSVSNTEILVTFTRPRRRAVRRSAGRRGARLRCVTSRPCLLEKREALSRQLGAMLFNQALRRVFSSQARAEALHIIATGCPHGPALPRGRLSTLSTCRLDSCGRRRRRGVAGLRCATSFLCLLEKCDTFSRQLGAVLPQALCSVLAS